MNIILLLGAFTLGCWAVILLEAILRRTPSHASPPPSTSPDPSSSPSFPLRFFNIFSFSSPDPSSSPSSSSTPDSDYGIPLGTLQQEALELSIAKGFDESDAAERLAFAMVEVGEAIQALRGHSITDIWYTVDSDGLLKPEGVEIEIADAFIRLAGLAQFHGLNISRGIRLKMPYNWQRKYGYGKIKGPEEPPQEGELREGVDR